jgi:hypothetical protein
MIEGRVDQSDEQGILNLTLLLDQSIHPPFNRDLCKFLDLYGFECAMMHGRIGSKLHLANTLISPHLATCTSHHIAFLQEQFGEVSSLGEDQEELSCNPLL